MTFSDRWQLLTSRDICWMHLMASRSATTCYCEITQSAQQMKAVRWHSKEAKNWHIREIEAAEKRVWRVRKADQKRFQETNGKEKTQMTEMLSTSENAKSIWKHLVKWEKTMENTVPMLRGETVPPWNSALFPVSRWYRLEPQVAVKVAVKTAGAAFKLQAMQA